VNNMERTWAAFGPKDEAERHRRVLALTAENVRLREALREIAEMSSMKAEQLASATAREALGEEPS